jgi:hypothetical protein
MVTVPRPRRLDLPREGRWFVAGGGNPQWPGTRPIAPQGGADGDRRPAGARLFGGRAFRGLAPPAIDHGPCGAVRPYGAKHATSGLLLVTAPGGKQGSARADKPPVAGAMCEKGFSHQRSEPRRVSERKSGPEAQAWAT